MNQLIQSFTKNETCQCVCLINKVRSNLSCLENVELVGNLIFAFLSIHQNFEFTIQVSFLLSGKFVVKDTVELESFEFYFTSVCENHSFSFRH